MSSGATSSSQADEIERACDEFKSAWGMGLRPQIETYLDRVPPPAIEDLLGSLLTLEFGLRVAVGEWPSPEAYLERFPGQAERILDLYRDASPHLEPTEPAREATESSPKGGAFAGREAASTGLDDPSTFANGAFDRPDSTTCAPTALSSGGPPAGARGAGGRQAEGYGRYHRVRLLGKGSFGRVYLARDGELDREVALKVISAGLVGSWVRCEGLLTEARIAAKLRHPGIVAVHDIGYDEGGEVFVVLDYVPGATLAVVFAEARPSPIRLAGIMLRVAEAVHHAHISGLVHRDLKPSNILIDSRGVPYVTDFGLAVSEAMQRLKSGEIAGTPSYMAPEQVRGEAHRLDGRTDVWALGVILYEGMTARLPFAGATREGLFEEIQGRDPKPVRQIDDRLPRELERITLKCLAKRMTDRYQTAADLAEDLQAWVASGGSTGSATSSSLLERPHALSVGDRVRVVPKGLRAFDTEDADFFLSLLPGPKDREGLPESVRFWKTRIEARGRDKVFSVGVMYGPSGCGKSSLVKAGLLPRLAEDVHTIYFEATPGGTESRLLAALRRDFPGLPRDAGLAEAAAAIREGRHGPASGKVLVIVDQFEQWLQAHVDVAETELVRALRQADGRRFQAIILVRDDFWMAVVRFMRALEVPLVEGGNSAAVELFDAAHARKVLVEFGRAGGNLPPEPAPPGPEAGRFLDRAVAGLAGKDGRVIPVRLILFAEVVRHRPWTPATISELGGIEGIGVTFLEETFSEGSAPPTHRFHRLAAQGVLKALLPDSHSDLKGSLRNARELQSAAGYVERPGDFAELMKILDAELRMVTPSDPEGLGDEVRGTKAAAGDVYYQLTHDYLIPPLRLWLHRSKQGTRRGRAETRLELITALWRDRPGSRQLPSLLEWLGIALYVGPRSWSGDAGRMMRSAARHHLLRAGALLALLAALAAGAWYAGERSASDFLLGQALKADYGELAGLLPEIKQRRAWLRAPLERIEARPVESGARDRQVAGALLFLTRPTPGRAVFLHKRLRVADPDEMVVILKVLSEHPGLAGPDELVARLGDDEEEAGSRLRAACALAAITPVRDDWPSASPVIVQALLAEDQRTIARWLQFLEPASPALVPELEHACRKPDLNAPSRMIAAEALAGILHQEGDALQLARSAVRIVPEASSVLVRRLARMEGLIPAREFLSAIVAKGPGGDAPRSGWDGDEGVLRRANAAFALLALDFPSPVWPLLRHDPDPTMRSELIRRIGDPPISRRMLLDRLREPGPDGAEKQALLLALAETDLESLSNHDRAEYADVADALHREAAEPGVHSAAELLLRRLGRPALLRASASSPGAGKAPSSGTQGTGWYQGPNGHTFAVLPSPLQFYMGSPKGEENREGWFYENFERRHFRRIDRQLEVSTTEVTRAQFETFNPSHLQDLEHSTGEGDSPANKVSWYEAARYCNWLSKLAEIPKDQWCYPESIGPGMSLPADAVEKAGYRLPTEAEWEGFCRAATETCRPFGRTAALLPRYGWVYLNAQEQSHPVGRLLPNEYGLFDLLGNVWEWCHDGSAPDDPEKEFPPYPEASRERPAGDPMRATEIGDKSFRMLRGGAFDWAPSMARSARRHSREVSIQYPYAGFRVVRTLPVK